MSFPKYPAYKNSGVEWLGEIPEHWELSPIKYLASLNPRKSDSDIAKGQLCSFVPMDKLKTGVLQLDEERLVEEVINGYTYFEEGDILQAKVTPCFENKNIAIARGLTNGIGFGSTEINVLRPSHRVSVEYLFYRLQEAHYMDFCTSSMIGAGGLKRVPTDAINNFKIAVPDLFEQTQIARFLDYETARIDALIEEQQRLIELLKEKRQAVISHAVTKGLDPTVPMKDSGVEWLGKVPAHWQVCKLNFRYSVELGKMLDEKRNIGVHPIPYLRNQDVQWGYINTDDLPLIDIEPSEYQRYTVRFGDLLVCEGGDVGRAAIWRCQNRIVGYQKALHRLRPRSLDLDTAEFFFFSLMTAKSLGVFDEDDTKATISHLPAEKFRQYKLVFPPLEEQHEISSMLGDMLKRSNKIISLAEHMISLLRERRSALISAAVTGKIDVRNWQPPVGVDTCNKAKGYTELEAVS